MTTLHELIETTLPIDETFAYVADFANARSGTRASPPPSDSTAAPSGVGTRYPPRGPHRRQGRPDGVLDLRVRTADPRRAGRIGVGRVGGR